METRPRPKCVIDREPDTGEYLRDPRDDRRRTTFSVDRLGGNPWSRTDFAVAGVVVLATMVVSWVFRTEIVSSDPWHYGMAAIEFPQDSWVPLGYTRYGMIIPLGPLVLAFGHAAVTFYAPAILASGVLAGSVYLLGRRWWGHLAGITAVLLLLSNWIVFVNLSRFYPDIPSISLVVAALVLAVAARGRQLAGQRWSDLLPVAVGFLLGWSSRRVRRRSSHGPR